MDFPIIITETIAAIWALTKAKPYSNIHFFVDNVGTIAFLNKGKPKALESLRPDIHFKFLQKSGYEIFNIITQYVKTDLNKADIFSRLEH